MPGDVELDFEEKRNLLGRGVRPLGGTGYECLLNIPQ